LGPSAPATAFRPWPRRGGLTATGILLPVLAGSVAASLFKGLRQPPCALPTTPRPPGSPDQARFLDHQSSHRDGSVGHRAPDLGKLLSNSGPGATPTGIGAILPVGTNGFAATGQGIRAIPPQRNSPYPQGIDRFTPRPAEARPPLLRHAAPVDPVFPQLVLSEENPAAVMPVQRHATSAALGAGQRIPVTVFVGQATDLRRNDRLPPRRPGAVALLPWKLGGAVRIPTARRQ